VVWGHVEIREDMNPYPIGAKVIIRYNRLKREVGPRDSSDSKVEPPHLVTRE